MRIAFRAEFALKKKINLIPLIKNNLQQLQYYNYAFIFIIIVFVSNQSQNKKYNLKQKKDMLRSSCSSHIVCSGVFSSIGVQFSLF